MALSKAEQLLLVEMKTMLNDKVELGLGVHKDSIKDESNSYQMLHENIDEQFALDAADLTHHQAITAAFKQTHDYKPLDSHTFHISFRKQMLSMGIPSDQIDKALQIADGVLAKVGVKKQGHERDTGWHPQLDEVMATANPEN